MASVADLVGKHVEVVLEDGSRFSSDLLAVSPVGLATFRQEPAHTYMKADYRIVSVAAIRSAKAVAGVAARPLPTFKTISDKEIAARTSQINASKEKILATKGVGVSDDAQALFDKLNKQLPCRWQGEHIIVTDAVVISPPYTEKEVGLAPGVDAAVFGDTFKRVQMMVGKFRDSITSPR